MQRLAGIVVVSFVVAACGGSSAPTAEAPKAQAPEAPAPAASATASADAAGGEDAPEKVKLPDACAGDASSCTMPSAFVRKLCKGVFPDLALMFFAKGTPWRRAYVAVREAAPFNGLSGPSSDEKLVFEEEVLILSEKKVDTGGMQVSGAGASFDTLRWDGTCATLSAEEVRFQTPPKPKHATVPWRSLEDPTQEALLKHEEFAKIAAERRKECKGATSGAVSAKCVKVDGKFNAMIVQAVREGVAVPAPSKLP